MPTGTNPTYISGSDHRPLPTANGTYRETHKASTNRRPTGLDWSKHRAPETPKPTVPDDHLKLPTEGNQGQPTTRSSAPRATSTSSTTGRAPVAGPSTHREKNPEVAQETRPAATSGLPAYALDIARVMATSEGHPNSTVRAARKVVANALVALNKALRATDTTPTPAPVKPKRQPTQRSARRVHSTPEAEAIIRLYTGPENLSCPQIAGRLDIGVKAVRATLDRAGIQRTDGRTTRSGGRNAKTIDDYDPQLVADIKTRYVDQQQNLAQIAGHHDCSSKLVTTILQRAGVTLRPPAHVVPPPQAKKLTEQQVDDICRRYEAGESSSRLATAFAVSVPTILGRLRGRGVTIRPKTGATPSSTTNQSGDTAA